MRGEVMSKAEGVDLRVVSSTRGVHIPRHVFVNGAEVAIPSGASIQIGDVADHSVTTVTLTMYVRNLHLVEGPP